MENKKNDQFADIAMKRIDKHKPDLIDPEPLEKAEIYLPLNKQKDSAGNFEPLNKMSTKDELQQELKLWKDRFQPFLQDLSPPLKSYRNITELNKFDWRIEEEPDRNNFQRVLSGEGNWEQVSIPHFGGPLGKAVTYYRTEFSMNSLPETGESCFICFKAADYKAHVFVNGCYSGSHEGFFSPFEFDISSSIKQGRNILVVKLENDYIFGGNVNAGSCGERFEGDKLYAATGPGYDDPEMGWHHCPPGMGIYQDLSIELRASVHIQDLFIRPQPEEKGAEAWVEINNTSVEPEDITLQLSLYGQNFKETIIEDYIFNPITRREVGLGDSFTEQKLRSEGLLDKPVSLSMGKGNNLLKVPLSLFNFRLWEPDSPWLYQLQVTILSEKGKILDTFSRQFGMRSFHLDTDCTPKGMFHLNGKPIRLRGANTMGHEQQCVMKKDWNQLIEDLLLARICNMNFLRLTQRPVQSEVYDYCDCLGLMTQTDLPLFGVLKRNKFCEAIRQAEEMERLVRSHPCNILVTYINEPFPNANNKPHRHLNREELENFFIAADIVVKMNNPDRVIKHVDGDYDPPSKTLPDNHCYTFWYNGHGLEAGLLHKGHWMSVRKGWNYGCGEFGVEGLESVDTMRKYYPRHWLPQSEAEEKSWSPRSIIGSQSGNFHYLFYQTPDSLEEWVRRSQIWQAEGLKIMTEAFRRDSRMVTFAVHLFIDAFPSGWMKTIMDVDRNPKPAYFTYRNALTPLMVNLRTDRFRYRSGEIVKLENWICNDLNDFPDGIRLAYFAEIDGQVIISGEKEAEIPPCSSRFQGYITFKAPEVDSKTVLKVRTAMIDPSGKVLHDAVEDLTLFPFENHAMGLNVWTSDEKRYRDFIDHFGLNSVSDPQKAQIIIAGKVEDCLEQEEKILRTLEGGAKLLFLNLPEGEHSFGGNHIAVRTCGMMPVHYVSPAGEKYFSDDLDREDFRFWYKRSVDRISPLLSSTFSSRDFTPVLTSGNIDEKGEWNPAFAMAEKSYGRGKIIVSQLDLEGMLIDNPPASILISRILQDGEGEK